MSETKKQCVEEIKEESEESEESGKKVVFKALRDILFNYIQILMAEPKFYHYFEELENWLDNPFECRPIINGIIYHNPHKLLKILHEHLVNFSNMYIVDRAKPTYERRWKEYYYKFYQVEILMHYHKKDRDIISMFKQYRTLYLEINNLELIDVV